MNVKYKGEQTSMRKSLVALLTLSLIRAAAQVSTTEFDEQHLLRRIRFGQRELHLPQQLENNNLTVANDKLDLKIATLEHREPDTDRVLIDQFLADQTKAAIRDAMVFAQMYHVSSSPVQALVKLDEKFDDADARCHPLDAEKHSAVFRNMAEAQSACGDLMAISSALTSHHVAIPQAWPSVYKEDVDYRTRTGYRLLVADREQLRRDEASHIDSNAKRLLIMYERSALIDDKQIWLTEMVEQETIDFNAKHPEHQMADMSGTLAMFVKFHEEQADLIAKFRRSVVKAP